MRTPTIPALRALAIGAALFATSCMVGDPDEDSKAGDGLGDELSMEDETPDADPTGPLFARVCADGVTTKGIDVSKWDATVNWSKVKATGVEFAFVRVSDGVNTPDAYFTTNWTGTKAAGIIRGAYQFFRPSQSVTTQADMMINAIGTYTPGDLPPVIDVEADGGLSPATVASKVRQWVDRVEAALGVRPIVYTGKYFWRDEVGGPSTFAPNALWIAAYTSLCPDLPSPWTRWTFWQYSETGTVNGISTDVDMNLFNGSLAQLQAFAGGVSGPPTKALPFSWVRNADGSYDFTVTPGTGVNKVELRVEDYLIGTAAIAGGTGTVHYTFNVARADRVIDAKGLTSGNAVVALGNGIIDSVVATSVAIHQTGEHEYELGLERAPSTWATVEVKSDGTTLTDIDTGLQRSTRRAVRYKFINFGSHAITLIARNSAGTVVDTRTRTLIVR